MTPEPPFEPTLDVPLAWIRELAGDANGSPEVLYLSYLPYLHQRAEELGCTLDDIEADLQSGYSFRKKEGRSRRVLHPLFGTVRGLRDSAAWKDLGDTIGHDRQDRLRQPEPRSVDRAAPADQAGPIQNELPASR